MSNYDFLKGLLELTNNLAESRIGNAQASSITTRDDDLKEIRQAITTLTARVEESNRLATENAELRAKLEQVELAVDTVKTLIAENTEVAPAATNTVWDGDMSILLVKLVHGIFQIAATIAPAFTFHGTDKNLSCMWLDSQFQILLRSVGAGIAQSPGLVMTAIQVGVGEYLSQLISDWDFGTESVEFQRLYKRVREKEHQSVSGKWKVLTLRHLRSAFPPEPKRYVKELGDAITNILALLGVERTTVQELRDTIMDRYQDQIAGVVDVALELQRIIQEDCESWDFEIFAPSFDATFDADKMEKDPVDDIPFPPTFVESETSVLCTTRLGLKKERRIKGEDLDGPLETKTRILMKPKVILRTIVPANADAAPADVVPT